MYNPKSYTNYINSTILSSAKSGINHSFLDMEDDNFFIIFPYTSHFISRDDLTPEALEIVQRGATPCKTSYFKCYAHPVYSNLNMIRLTSSFIPKEKSTGLKRMLEYTGRYHHYVNEKLLKKFGKIGKLCIFCADNSPLEPLFVYKYYDVNTPIEYVGCIMPINANLDKFIKETDPE